jgi:GLPGLI family protein
MMRTTLIAFITLLLTANILFAQNERFATSGTIEYDKTVNTFAVIKKLYAGNDNTFIQQGFEQYKKTQPQFKTVKSTLSFGNDKTLFTPIVPETPINNFFGIPMTDQYNTIYSDMSTNTSTVQKVVFEQTFLIKDTIRKIKWKITDETRDILGYPCTRANGLMLDSIYVVAFYTDKIPVSGGPESFAGLPGMILEVALPHENVIWRATKVTETDPAPIVPPKKGKPLNSKQLFETLQSVFKGRGDANQINYILKVYIL